MADIKKVIEGLEAMREFFGFGLPSQPPVFEAYQNILTDTLALLKEQDNCENCAIAIEDRQPVVRCRDCIHQYYDLKDGRIVCGNVDDGEIHHADWYCADGEAKNDREDSESL